MVVCDGTPPLPGLFDYGIKLSGNDSPRVENRPQGRGSIQQKATAVAVSSQSVNMLPAAAATVVLVVVTNTTLVLSKLQIGSFNKQVLQWCICVSISCSDWVLHVVDVWEVT